MAIRDEILAIIEDVKQSRVDARDSERPLRDLGLDSLDVANVLLAVEERFGIKIPDADMSLLGTVRALSDYVEARAGGR